MMRASRLAAGRELYTIRWREGSGSQSSWGHSMHGLSLHCYESRHPHILTYALFSGSLAAVPAAPSGFFRA